MIRILLAVMLWLPLPAAAVDDPWLSEDGTAIKLHVFHSLTCPHCAKAMPWIEQLAEQTDWLELYEYEVSQSEAARARFNLFARQVGQPVQGVPAFFFCDTMVVGFDRPEGVGARLLQALEQCRTQRIGAGDGDIADDAAPVLPPPATRVAGLQLDSLSLPVTAVLLGGLDAFNPCAFFVLLFLLSLMVNARSRFRMALIGGIFVTFSGLIYFAFMAAWLNLFLVLEGLAVVTFIAGLVAVVIGTLNVRDVFAPARGPSLSISDDNKTNLFARMRGLLNADNMPAMIGGTVVLAIVANSYELLCTSGFPLVFTRILTLEELPTLSYYGYLALYNLVYVVPLIVIVMLFTVTLGRRKLSEGEGRLLKLTSGLMMLGLGLVLVIAPGTLDNLATTLGILVLAVGGTAVYALVTRKRKLADQAR